MSAATTAAGLFGQPCVSPDFVLRRAPAFRHAMLRALQRLTPEPYALATTTHHLSGMARFGGDWDFVDLPLLAYTCAAIAQPESYLEIGVRRGRSMACVLAACPMVRATGIDLWIKDYAGVENPGPDFIREELSRMTPSPRVELLVANSHEALRTLPAESFDLITVDGDHTEPGAWQDLTDSARLLRPGGLMVFDDLTHPQFRYLADVWMRFVREHDFVQAAYTASGLGAAVALKRAL
jgi:SAM-dependent methyltransferase